VSQDTSNRGFLLPGLSVLCLVGDGCATPEVSIHSETMCYDIMNDDLLSSKKLDE